MMKKQEGFTLVELMVVVGIVGILAAVGIPQFQNYQARARTSDAKLALAGAYTAMTSLMGDYDNYATCLKDAGYDHPSKTYYAVGFKTENTAANSEVRTRGGVCTDGANFQFDANKKIAGAAMTGADLPANAVVDPAFNKFKVGAIGVVDPDNNTAANASIFTIDHDKEITQAQKGY